ncbi:unnamed protein product [Eruca vesicaria subsp. sativa]|uniref:Uncharacterized protein n=1 Tax=Eruca vesicaria subsp. sativa TaxID=29727 RepID=A0ABC8KCH5_ERUVS|nr:unnamed protein product [Eruca vesicaria subsp. sativa]
MNGAGGVACEARRKAPVEVSKDKGVVAVGAFGWVSNYDVPVMSTDLKAVRRMARKASERGGGFASVQTMALVWTGRES